MPGVQTSEVYMGETNLSPSFPLALVHSISDAVEPKSFLYLSACRVKSLFINLTVDNLLVVIQKRLGKKINDACFFFYFDDQNFHFSSIL